MPKHTYVVAAVALTVSLGCKIRKPINSDELKSAPATAVRVDLSDEASSSLFTLMDKSNELLDGNFYEPGAGDAKRLDADSVICSRVVAPEAPFTCTLERAAKGRLIKASSMDLIKASERDKPGILLLSEIAFVELGRLGVTSAQTNPPTLGATILKATDLVCVRSANPNARAQCSIAKPGTAASSATMVLRDNAAIALYELLYKSVDYLGVPFNATTGVGAMTLKVDTVTCSHPVVPSPPHLCSMSRKKDDTVETATSKQLADARPDNTPGILLLTKAVFEGMQEVGVTVAPSEHPVLGATSLTIVNVECTKVVSPNATPKCTFQTK